MKGQRIDRVGFLKIARGQTAPLVVVKLTNCYYGSCAKKTAKNLVYRQ